MTRLWSAKSNRPDMRDPDIQNEECNCFLMIRPDRPVPSAAILVSAVLLLSIIIAGLMLMDWALPGGLLPWIVLLVEAIIRWPALFAIAGVLVFVFVSRWRNRP